MSQPIKFPTNGIIKALENKLLADPGSKFDSRKNRRTLPVWAPRDLEFCEIAERANDVLSFEDRPEILSLTYGGHKVFYVVDFRVNTVCSTILVGLSLFGKPGDTDEAPIHKLAKAYCARRGDEFVHVPDARLFRVAARMPRSVAA